MNLEILYSKKIKLIIKGTFFLFALYIFIFNRSSFNMFLPGETFNVFTIVFILLMIEMIIEVLPGVMTHRGAKKLYKRNYDSVEYNKEIFLKEKKETDNKVIGMLVIWIIPLIGVGVFSYYKIITAKFLVLVFLLLWLLDQLFIDIWCPLKKYIIKNRCCTTCRFYNWGWAMLLCPLIFIPSIYCYILLVCGISILLQWEYLYYKFPERFYDRSNKNLRCIRCRQCSNGDGL